MTSLKIGLELDDMLSKAELSFEKAKIMVEDIEETYFLQEPEEVDKIFLALHYRKAQIKQLIANTFLNDLEKELQELRKFADMLYEQNKTTAAEQGKEVAKCQT